MIYVHVVPRRWFVMRTKMNEHGMCMNLGRVYLVHDKFSLFTYLSGVCLCVFFIYLYLCGKSQ
jgi:hypothetical protein